MRLSLLTSTQASAIPKPAAAAQQPRASTRTARGARVGTPLASPDAAAFDGFHSHGRLGMFSKASTQEAFSRVAWAQTHFQHEYPRSSGRRAVVSAVFEGFTERAIRAIMSAQKEASFMKHKELSTEQLLLGLINVEGRHGQQSSCFAAAGVTTEGVKETYNALQAEGVLLSTSNADVSPDKPAMEIPFSLGCKHVFEAALEESRKLRHDFISPEHLLVALLTVEMDGGIKILDCMGVSKERLRNDALARLRGQLADEGRFTANLPDPMQQGTPPPALAGNSVSSSTSTLSRGSRQDKSALADFCLDLTARAADGKIDPVIGREKEVERVVKILAGRRKNSPMLLGEPGTGTTAIAEGLALRINEGKVPEFLQDKKIFSLDLELMLAGTKERGELEKRINSVISEAQTAGDVILVIDEIHTMVGMSVVSHGGAAGSGLDVGNLLKPALSRGQLQCIGASTQKEGRQHVEKDKALARRFQPVDVPEPSQALVKASSPLNALTSLIHSSLKSAAAAAAAAPAAASVAVPRYGTKNPRETTADSKKTEFERRMQDSNKGLVLVNHEDIAAVASRWSAAPFQQLAQDETSQVVNQDRELGRRVVGQDEAVSAISRAVWRGRVGMKDPKRPIAALMFCGPTGVGKTELAKSLAHSYFGTKDAMVRLDMSEYMERQCVSKLIGAPRGYIGCDEPGKLTEAVRKRPFSLILFNEIEKAHPDFFNMLLQILDNGRLTDSKGRVVSFKNCLIVMTSNVASQVIARVGSSRMGFTFGADDDAPDGGRNAALKETVKEEFKGHFCPELLDRIDEVVVFRPLEKSQVPAIVEKLLQETVDRIAKKDIRLEDSDAVITKVIDEGYDRSHDARLLGRAVAQLIEDPVSEALIGRDNWGAGDTASVDVNDDHQVTVAWLAMPDMCNHPLWIRAFMLGAAIDSSIQAAFPANAFGADLGPISEKVTGIFAGVADLLMSAIPVAVVLAFGGQVVFLRSTVANIEGKFGMLDNSIKELDQRLDGKIEGKFEILANSIKELANSIEKLANRLDEKIEGKFETLDAKIEGGFKALDAKIEGRFEALDAGVDAKFAGVDAKFAVVDAKFGALDAKIEGRFEALDAGVDAKFAVVDAKFAVVDVKLEVLGAKCEAIDVSIKALDNKVDKMCDLIKNLDV